LTTLKAELIQKLSVYSEAHPVVTALKKRIATIEKNLTLTAAKQSSNPADDIDALKRQREVLQTRLAEANSKLATARLSERLDEDQKSERLQVIETPSVPQRPLKSSRIKLIAMAFAGAIAAGIGAVVAAEFLDGSIRGPHQLLRVVARPLIVTIPYIKTRAEISRARWRVAFSIASTLVVVSVLIGMATAIVLNLPINLSLLDNLRTGFLTTT
jgi:hypothetical protein